MARFLRTAPLAVLSALLLALALATAASAATFNVDTTSDDYRADCTDAPDDCSIRGALDNANATADDDSVVIPAGIYRFDDNFSGLFVGHGGSYDSPDPGALTIQGAGAGETIIDADGKSRVLTIEDSTVEISGVTLRDGNVRFRKGRRILLDVGLDGDSPVVNLADGTTERLPAAAGLSSLGPIDATGLSLDSGGGLSAVGSDVTLIDSVVSHNAAGTTGAAGGILNLDGRLKLIRSTVHRNNAGVVGGGIVNLGILELEDSTVSDNTAFILGGGILNMGRLAIDSSTISGNYTWGHGAGLMNLGLSAPVELPNLAASVAADVTDSPAGDSVITGSTFSDNAVLFGQGGAVLHASLTPVAPPEECLPVEDELGNPCEALSDGPAPSKLVLLADTFADNASIDANNMFLPVGGADWGHGSSIYAAGPVDIGNSVIADGTARGGADNCGVADDDTDLIQTLGNNVETWAGQEGDVLYGTCFLDTDQNDTVVKDVRLGDLRDNGGPTKTRALRTGSPAINSYAADTCPDDDQRGGARPPENGSAGDACDAGAYEANSLADLSIDSHTDAPDPATVGSPLTYSIVVRNAGPDAINGVKVTHALPAGVELVSAANGEVGTLAAGESRTLEAIVRPTAVDEIVSTATVGAAGMTDTKPSNDSATAKTQVAAAPLPQQQPQQQEPQDENVNLNLTVPTTATVDQFLNGIIIEADCQDEPCLRRFREHAAINTGATRIAGFNLTVSRTFLPMSSTKKQVRLRPCLSGSKTGKPHKRCMKNLRKAVKKAGTFKVKVVVTATDKAGNTVAKKAIITIKPKR
jgi:uncharacterized repeat protein (TIGR01451 family)